MNPREAWHATVHGATKSWTWLSNGTTANGWDICKRLWMHGGRPFWGHRPRVNNQKVMKFWLFNLKNYYNRFYFFFLLFHNLAIFYLIYMYEFLNPLWFCYYKQLSLYVYLLHMGQYFFMLGFWKWNCWGRGIYYFNWSVQSLSCVQLLLTPWIAACQASLSITNSRSPSKPMSIELVMPSNHPIFYRPLLLLPSIFPSNRVFSSESALRIRWPKYWSFSFNISLSNEHPGLISFRMDWLDLLAVQGTLKSLL